MNIMFIVCSWFGGCNQYFLFFLKKTISAHGDVRQSGRLAAAACSSESLLVHREYGAG